MNVLIFTLALVSLPAFAATPDDGQIIGIVHAANHAEISSSEAAKTKSTQDGIKDFANKMIEEHSDVDKKLVALSGTANIPPGESADSKKIDKESATVGKKMAKEEGKALDKYYVSKQISMHEDVLKSLNKELIPSAKNADLKTMLEKIKASVEEHLAMAKALKKSL